MEQNNEHVFKIYLKYVNASIIQWEVMEIIKHTGSLSLSHHSCKNILSEMYHLHCMSVAVIELGSYYQWLLPIILSSFMSNWHKLQASERGGTQLTKCLH